MYESHFGLSGPPFQLNPDPAFYFDSRGHSNALAYLKFGVHQGEGFIVVTGEIGAGKTTLVRTLLEGLDAEKVVAAQVVSTQLESGDLLRAILTAYGVPTAGASKAHLIASLEGFLTALAAKGRRALLIVDEAQNLKHEAVEELRMLSNFQLGNHALLQSFLIGQPELRTLLQSKSMEQLRQRVIASCHLGPLDQTETRAYIEHRLHRVGWKDSPAFADDAFDAIHRWTGGVPRRINRLCNRLFLAAFLSGKDAISAETVDQTAGELRSEIGELADVPMLVSTAGHATGHGRPDVTIPPNPALPVLDAAVDFGGNIGNNANLGVVQRSRSGSKLQRPLLCVVDTRTDFLKIGALSRVLEEYGDLPPVMAVQPGTEEGLAIGAAGAAVLPLPKMEIHLGIGAHAVGVAHGSAAALTRFDEVLAEFMPSAVLAVGKSDAVLMCTLLANKRGVPVLRLDAGQRNTGGSASAEMNGVLIDRVADALYTNKLLTYYTLYREGIPSDRVHCVGSLAANLLHFGLPHAVPPLESFARAKLSPAVLNDPRGFGLVSLALQPKTMDELLPMLATLGRELPLVWPLREEALVALKSTGQEARLADAGVIVMPAQGYLEEIGLLQQARCLIAGSEGELVEEAVTLGVRSITLGNDRSGTPVADPSSIVVGRNVEQALKAVREILLTESARVDVPEYWDGGTASRIAKHLRSWLPASMRVSSTARAAESVR
jgi:general secretion pathway protein A